MEGFSAEELNIMRQWFDSLQDLCPQVLEEKDYQLAEKLYVLCTMRVPNSISKETVHG